MDVLLRKKPIDLPSAAAQQEHPAKLEMVESVPVKEMQVTTKTLIDKARAAGIKGYSKMKKAQLETVLNTKIPEAIKNTDSTKVATTPATLIAPEASQNHLPSTAGMVPIASEASPIVAQEATKDATTPASLVASGATKEQKSVHFEPSEPAKQLRAKLGSSESEKLDLKLNSMTMSELRLVCKKSNIKVSKYNGKIRKSIPKNRKELMSDLKKFCMENATNLVIKIFIINITLVNTMIFSYINSPTIHITAFTSKGLW